MTQQVLLSKVLNEHALDADLIVRSEICYLNSCNCNSCRVELVQWLVNCYVMQEYSGFHPAAFFVYSLHVLPPAWALYKDIH